MNHRYKITKDNTKSLLFFEDLSRISFFTEIYFFQQERIDLKIARKGLSMVMLCKELGNTMYLLYGNKEKMFFYKNCEAQIYYKRFEYSKINDDILERGKYSAGDEINGYCAADMIYAAILSKDFKLAKRCVNIIYNLSDYKKRPGGKPYDYISYIIKCWLNEDEGNILQYINNLRKFRAQKQCKVLFKYVIDIILAIQEKNEATLNDKLFGLSNIYKRTLGDAFEYEKYFSIDGIVLAILAKKRGMRVTIDTPVIPADLLDVQEIEYKRIEDMKIYMSKHEFDEFCTNKVKQMIDEVKKYRKIVNKYHKKDSDDYIELMNEMDEKEQSAIKLDTLKKSIVNKWNGIGYIKALEQVKPWFDLKIKER